MGTADSNREPLRALLVVQPTGAGTARHVADLAEGLKAAGGVEVTVACPKGGMLNERLKRAGVTVVELPLVRDINVLADIRGFFQLFRLCRRLKPDVLHAHSSKAGFLGRVAGKLAGVSVVVFTPHCWSFQSASGRKRAFYIALERFASRFCDLTVTVSAREAEEAVELRVLPKERLRVIPNGVSPAEFESSPGVTRDIPFVSVGRLDEQKGYVYLIEAMAELIRVEPSARLVLVGDGSQRAELEELARSLGVADGVDFEGEQPGAGSYLRRAHVFVLSSLWEGLPYTIIEAMAAGLPVISTDVGGCRELVLDGETGLLVGPRDPKALAKAMQTMWSDEALRRRFGEAGRAYAGRSFRIEACVEANARAYREIYARKHAHSEVSPVVLFGRRGAVVMVTLAVLATVVALGDQLVNREKILSGVQVATVAVGGSTISEATMRLTSALESPVRVSFADTSTVIAMDTVAMDSEVREAADAAFAVGRVGALPERVGQRFSALAGDVVLPVVAPREGEVETLVRKARSRLDTEPVDAAFRWEDGEVTVSSAKPGARVDVEALLAALGRAAVASNPADRQVRVPVVVTPAAVSDEDVRAHLAQAAQWTNAPVVGSTQGKSVTLSGAALAACLVVEGGSLGVSSENLGEELHSKSLPRTAPRDARFSVSGGAPVIIAEVPGSQVDATATAVALRRALAAGERRFDIALETVQPDITESDLVAMGITRELSSFTTEFDPDVDGRDDNIRLASTAFRGKVVGVGEVFSLNKTTGPRGRTSGYKESLVFLKGKVVPGIGGGVCQVSSTLYEAALFAGLRIVERHSHSMAVSYVDPGRDATAYYPILDLKFQNNTGSPIMLWSEDRNGKLTVKVFGSGEKPDIRVKTVVRKTIRPGRHMVYDSTLPHNKRVVESVGRPGYVVVSYRLTYENGRVVKRETLASDEYQPREWVIRVGI